jgi:hypothetical protein
VGLPDVCSLVLVRPSVVNPHASLHFGMRKRTEAR